MIGSDEVTIDDVYGNSVFVFRGNGSLEERQRRILWLEAHGYIIRGNTVQNASKSSILNYYNAKTRGLTVAALLAS